MGIVQVAVKALIVDNKKFLILKQKSGGRIWWDLPGGRMKFGESPSDCLTREVLEETGLKIEVQRPVGVWHFFWSDKDIQVVCITYLCALVSGSVNTANNPDVEEELVFSGWLSLEEFLKQADNAEINEGMKKMLIEHFINE